MASKPFKERDNIHCPAAYTLSILGGKWHVPILWTLKHNHVMRYNELRREIEGITNIMLTQTLKDLEQLGLIHREQFNEVPPRVEYSLTEDGGSLLDSVAELAKWGRKHLEKQK